MSEPTFYHIFLNNIGNKISYSPISRPSGDKKLPSRNRQTHGTYLRQRFEAIQQESQINQQRRSALSLEIKDGIYLRISGQAGMIMETKSFDLRSKGIRILQQYEIIDENSEPISIVIIYIPQDKISVFLQKTTEYLEENNSYGNPKNAPLLIGIENIRLATLEHFWKGDSDILTNKNNTVWCEFWLRTYPKQEELIINEFKESSESINIELRENQQINFPERTVLLGRASVEQLIELLEITPHLAEIRPAKIPVSFLIDASPAEQAEFAKELAGRLIIENENNISILILDTGVNHKHILLEKSISDNNLYTYLEEWGLNDNNGHGTGMSGLALLGDLHPLLNNTNANLIIINHALESGKIQPKKGESPYHLYGHIIKEVISRSEIQEPNRKRIFCLATTSDEYLTSGVPTSWSAAIDNLCSGAEDGEQRLFFISAGNIRNENDWLNFPETNLRASVEDPAQSWNAITVGAYTEKTFINKQEYPSFEPIVQSGNLSPYSTTSKNWDYKKWPIKPDIVMEGGNAMMEDNLYASTSDDLSPLSIWYKPTQRQFEPFGMTSGATALAARMAAQIQNTYPSILPETIRALMIHSAEWTQAMLDTFLTNQNKGGYRDLVRSCGFGVPSLERATTCLKNRLNLVIESTIQPFYKNEKGNYSNNEMEVFELPWPKDKLLEIGETEVELRITLSYFIEPGPGEIGWKDRYRYASHGLRFDLSRIGEDKELFLARINKKNREDIENYSNDNPDVNWLLGTNNRQLGSIHSDIWRGTAAEMATCNLIGVYPVIGWWKERAYLEKYNKETRYSLIVSLKTAATEVDIYTPVAIQIGIPIEITS